MITSIVEMPDQAKVWVYQANRPFSDSERILIEKNLEAFCGQWAAHGKQLTSTYSIEKNQFIILAVDESGHQASGCSIDSSVHFIQQIEQATGLSLLDKSQVAFETEEGIIIKPFNKLKEAVTTGEIKPDTIVFNNAIQNAAEWKSSWAIPANQSWLKRFFSVN